MSASIAAFLSAGRLVDLADEIAEAVVQIDAEFRRSVAACLAKRSLKNTRTAWPKMIGSETFIIVALRWSEKSTPSCFGLRDLLLEEGDERLLAHERGVEDFAGLERRLLLEDRRRCHPRATNSIFTSVAAGTVTDFSLEKKSSLPIVATVVFESGDHAPIECGCFRAYSLTAFGARRSELPSRRTGFTALPLTLS